MADASEALSRAWSTVFAAASSSAPSTPPTPLLSLSSFGPAPAAVPVAALGADEAADGDVVVEVHFEGAGGSSSSSDDDDAD